MNAGARNGNPTNTPKRTLNPTIQFLATQNAQRLARRAHIRCGEMVSDCGTLTNGYLLSLGFLKVLNLAVEKVDG